MGMLSQGRIPRRRTERGSRRGVGGFILGCGASLSRGQEDRGSMGRETAWALHPGSLNACSSGDGLCYSLCLLGCELRPNSPCVPRVGPSRADSWEEAGADPFPVENDICDRVSRVCLSPHINPLSQVFNFLLIPVAQACEQPIFTP